MYHTNLVESGLVVLPMSAELKVLPVAVSAETEGVQTLKPQAVSRVDGEVGGWLKTPVNAATLCSISRKQMRPV